MLWKGREQSKNVEDRRTGRQVATGLGLGTIIIFVIALLFGENPFHLLQQVESSRQQYQPQTGSKQTDELGEFVSVVLKDTEDVWHKIFREQLNQRYQEPNLVLFEGQDRSAVALRVRQPALFIVRPTINIHRFVFLQPTKKPVSRTGDFAMAYVVAHEVAHHVQNLLGITRQVQSQEAESAKLLITICRPVWNCKPTF